ncbi:MAG: methyltransferase domain-containing protein [Acidobacteriota bacterium]|nr:methyltransferase domain-containing protein [Acidobacteriota bacterium]
MLREDQESLREGILTCSNPQCLHEYPVIDGIPILVADLRAYITQNILPLLKRADLSSTMESLLGDCCGPGAAFDFQRQHLSTYVFNHYGEFDTDAAPVTDLPFYSIATVLRKGISLLGGIPEGLILDLGCSVGRTAFEHASGSNDLVLGIDLNFSMLQIAGKILDSRTVTYDRRRGGLIFEPREFPVSFPRMDAVDFWVADVTNLPFADATMALGSSLNLLDCVSSPYDHLRELTRVLRPGGAALLSTPYDWSQYTTAVESWIGGHSQRSENLGRSADILRSLFENGSHPQAIKGMALAAEADNVPWTLRLHDRSIMTYFSHLLVGRKNPDPA